MDLHYSLPVERRGRATWLSHRVVVAGFTVLAALANFTAAGAQNPAADSPPQCTPATLRVALTKGGQQSYTIVGELCLPPHGLATAGHLTTPGAPYDHPYWNWPKSPPIDCHSKRLATSCRAIF